MKTAVKSERVLKDHLADAEQAAKYLTACYEEGPDVFLQGLRDVVEALQLTGRLPRIYLITVSAEDMEPMTIKLSPAVQESVCQIVDKLHTLLWDWWRERHLASAGETEDLLFSFA